MDIKHFYIELFYFYRCIQMSKYNEQPRISSNQNKTHSVKKQNSIQFQGKTKQHNTIKAYRMINDFMKIIYQTVHDSLGDKSTEYIKNRAQSLGIENKQCYHKERLMFLISQHIAYHIDLHVQQSKLTLNGSGKVDPLMTSCNINFLLKKKNLLLEQQNNTRNHSMQFVIAAFMHHYICGPNDITKSVKLIEDLQTELLSQYEIQQITLETFKQNERIKQLLNQRQFSCICPYGEGQQSARCQKCMRKFHPECQYQKILCNRCFLSHYFFPIDATFFSKFGQKRKTQTYFHSKFRCHNPNNKKKSQLFAIKFDIDDFQDLQNANQPEFIIKIINFKNLASNEERLQKWKMLNSRWGENSIFLNFNRFEFFLNFYPLRRKHLYFRDENSLIFKLQNRMPKIKDNILMIKCDPHFFQDETYEIGIYRVSRIKFINSKEKNVEQHRQTIENIHNNEENSHSVRITVEQFNLVKKYSKMQKQILLQPNNVKSQIPIIKMNQSDDDNQNQKSSYFQLVRSYGCNHKKGFDLAELKRNHLKFMESNRQTNRNKEFKIQIQKLIEKHLFKQYKKHALRMNIKTQENLPFKENHLQSIRRYCIDNNLLKSLEIPELQNFEKNLVESEIKKYIGRYQIKNGKTKKQNRKQDNEKEYKKYKKFAKCPICKNYLTSLYLLPDQYREGEQLRISTTTRTLKKKKTKLTEQQAHKTMLQMFRPKSIFRCKRNKKQEQSESQYNNSSEDNIDEMDRQDDQQNIVPLSLHSLLSNENHKQIFENNEELVHKIYIPSVKQKEMETNCVEVKVMSEESNSDYSDEDQQIPQENIIKIDDSQLHLQEISFDSPIIKFQEVKFYNSYPKTFSQHIKRQFFQIEDLQNEQNQNLIKENIKNPQCRKETKKMNTKQNELENKKRRNNSYTLPPRQTIQISLLSQDSEQEGEMKIYDIKKLSHIDFKK